MAKIEHDHRCKNCDCEFTVKIPVGVFYQPTCPACGRGVRLAAKLPVVKVDTPAPQFEQVSLF